MQKTRRVAPGFFVDYAHLNGKSIDKDVALPMLVVAYMP